jgi:hypothetical protein
VPFDTVTRDGLLQADGFVASRVTFYAALYPALREAAHHAGYALALHGSLAKDLDVVAVPWVSAAVPAEELVRVLCEAAGGFVDARGSTQQPHGRRSWTIHLGTSGGYVDLSVIVPVICTERLTPEREAQIRALDLGTATSGEWANARDDLLAALAALR